ncbi:hypothetical protein Cfla_0678 [Cellulomonas flavigena DSM 20109]|uniref:Uncharacterized protein n=1 Tax=Cellulomonas flavigena (strain ATCC 482 / DSM 20109 / BCRC 11376 / JCM 18109 / NBRC 3775 / NCIMB 8073 / NRS 134) TaxID=446466 RepID=D5UJ67_CELFN|nr:hypothetical protein [Cellulomonas flavigena]ADG73590.1 hypothetical protein Cfla_0678 [Cellulomonas flavigena DSM 20109]
MRATATVRAVAPVVRRARLRPDLRPHLLGALAVLLSALSVVLAAHGRVLLHQCVVADGPLASVGVRMAVLRSAVECPEGTLGLGAASTGAVLLLSVALPVVVLHLLLVACGLGLGVVLRRGAAAVASLLVAHLLPPVVAVGLPAVAERRALAGTGAGLRVPRDREHDPARPRRGPPVR